MDAAPTGRSARPWADPAALLFTSAHSRIPWTSLAGALSAPHFWRSQSQPPKASLQLTAPCPATFRGSLQRVMEQNLLAPHRFPLGTSQREAVATSVMPEMPEDEKDESK